MEVVDGRREEERRKTIGCFGGLERSKFVNRIRRLSFLPNAFRTFGEKNFKARQTVADE